MGLKCKISYENGVARVTDESGDPSSLYLNILFLVGDQDTALNVWATAYTNDFGNKGEQASVTELIRYFDAKVATENSLSESEIYQIKDFMKRSGIGSLSELNSTLIKIFKPNGFFEVNAKAAVDSGIYSQDEIMSIDPKSLQQILHKIEGHLLIEDIKVDPEIQKYEHKNSERKTIFGTHERVSNKELDRAIVNAVGSFTDVESFYNGIKNLPYSDFVYDFVNDDVFANEVMSRFKDLKSIPRLSILNGDLSSEDNTVYTTVKNTLLANTNNIELESEISYLNSIPQDIWENNQEDIVKILQEIEEVLVTLNIDVIGISQNPKNREEIMELLHSANDLIVNTSERTLINFANIHKVVLPQPQKRVVQKVPEKYIGYNIVSLYSEESRTNLFNKYGLIEIGDNQYHKVDQEADINDVRDYIYSEIKDGRMSIPMEYMLTKDINDKHKVLEDISRYLMSRSTPAGLNNQELYSGYQIAFRHSELPTKINQVKGLTRIKTNEQYLKTSFVSDFYNYILREKLIGSEIYKNTLSKFEINDKDISLIDTIDSIENIEFSRELKDYILLKKDSEMRYLVEDSDAIVSEDMLNINFPNLLREYEGDLILAGEYIVAPTTSENYIKLNGQLYRKGLQSDNSDLFIRVVTPTNNVYYTNNTDFEFNRSEARDVLDKYSNIEPDVLSYSGFRNIVSKSRINEDMRSDLKIFSTLKDKSYIFFNVNNSIVAYKDGVRVGAIRPDLDKGGYSDPKLSVSELHRGKGVGTELYLRLFDKIAKEDKVFYPSEIRTKQAENVFFRLEGLLEEVVGGGYKVKNSEQQIKKENLEDFNSVISSRLELLDIYSSKEEVGILNKIEDCAG